MVCHLGMERPLWTTWDTILTACQSLSQGGSQIWICIGRIQRAQVKHTNSYLHQIMVTNQLLNFFKNKFAFIMKNN